MCQPKDKDWLSEYRNKTPIYCLQETHLKTREKYRLKVKGWKRYSTQIETKSKQYSYQIK